MSRTHSQFKGTIWEESLYTLICISFYIFTVLLKYLRRLYACGSIFKCCQCIITATAPATLAVATLAALTPDYEVLTNQGDAPVLVYIDSIAL